MAGEARAASVEWEAMFRESDPQRMMEDGWPFQLRVCVPRGRSPRHPHFQMIREIGSGRIEAVMAGTSLNELVSRVPIHLDFVFPERYLEPWEQQAFLLCLVGHPQARWVTSVDVVTQSPLIISGLRKETITLLRWSEDDEHTVTRSERVNAAVRIALDQIDLTRRAARQ
jgi:hypothetical protein